MTDALVIPEVAFLRCAALYFENRPTNGEDAAHWSNVYNAENCRKAAAEIERLRAEVERLTREERSAWESRDFWMKAAEAENARAEAAEAQCDRLREALTDALDALVQDEITFKADHWALTKRIAALIAKPALSPATGEG